MDKLSCKYSDYVAILKEELIPAEGCTEPIAIAYAAAKCRKLLGEQARSCCLCVSGSIIKNVKSVVVPHTGGEKGLEIAMAAGVVGGNPDAALEVLSGIADSQLDVIKTFAQEADIKIVTADNELPFYIDITLRGQMHTARVVIKDAHTNIVLMQLDGQTVWEQTVKCADGHKTDRSVLNTEGILDFANSVDIGDVCELIKRMIDFNSAISIEGLKGGWGGEIGKTLLVSCGSDLHTLAKAAAAAGSDARMSGCELPVVIVSGSGNQGITASLPVLEYAKALHSDEEKLYRSLVLSALITIHIKSGIGPVSAFCGAVCAGVGAGCGVAYLNGADLRAINHTIVNGLAICSGMVCDGAKPSCAAKVSMAVEAGLLGYSIYVQRKQFRNGEGIVKSNVERTIAAVSDMARNGMRQTDKKILEIMLDN